MKFGTGRLEAVSLGWPIDAIVIVMGLSPYERDCTCTLGVSAVDSISLSFLSQFCPQARPALVWFRRVK